MSFSGLFCAHQNTKLFTFQYFPTQVYFVFIKTLNFLLFSIFVYLDDFNTEHNIIYVS